MLAFHKVDRGGGSLVVDRLHAFLGQSTGVVDRLLANLAEAWIDRRIISVGGFAFEHAARAELLQILWILRIVRQARALPRR